VNNSGADSLYGRGSVTLPSVRPKRKAFAKLSNRALFPTLGASPRVRKGAFNYNDRRKFSMSRFCDLLKVRWNTSTTRSSSEFWRRARN
jgi:hypothetical protein